MKEFYQIIWEILVLIFIITKVEQWRLKLRDLTFKFTVLPIQIWLSSEENDNYKEYSYNSSIRLPNTIQPFIFL